MCGKKVAAIAMCGENNKVYCSPDETWNLQGDPVIPGEGADDTIRVVGTQVSLFVFFTKWKFWQRREMDVETVAWPKQVIYKGQRKLMAQD